MKKISLLLLSALLIGGASNAQKCATDQQYQETIQRNPKVAEAQAKLEADIANYMQRVDIRKFAKGAGIDPDTNNIDIPMVVHIIHNYGSDYISDDQIYAMVARLNLYYSKRNPDTGSVIAPFKPYIGNAHVTFHLATKDPQGKATHGITRRYSYLANGGDDAAKFDQWAPDSYYNLWLETRIGRGVSNGVVLAYATFPGSGANNPYSDGVISRYDQATPGAGFYEGTTIAHETGHYLNLFHPWNSSGTDVGGACGDDAVDDTPPTKGHFSTCPLYDTVCAKNYAKTYNNTQSLALFDDTLHKSVDYPDTTNTQNIMDYSSCTVMFTKQQVKRMRAALKSSVGNRNNLWSSGNLASTGALAPFPDLNPKADFSINRPFVCADGNTSVNFTNRSWNDTLETADWTFSNGASIPTSTNIPNVANVTFTEPGWVNASLIVKGNNTGSDTISKNRLVYAADPTPIVPNGYSDVMSFDDASRTAKWPIFNYYTSDHKWELVSTAGVDNNYSIRFANIDPRPYAQLSDFTATPSGVFADFYSQAYDLSSIGANTRLTFAYSGAYRTTSPVELNDRLQIAVSADCGQSWMALDSLDKSAVGSEGYIFNSFVPNPYQWKWHETSLSTIAGEPKVFFRFRFTSGTDNTTLLGTGNNFYMDRITVTDNPLGVNPTQLTSEGVILAPNPTSGSATLTIKGGDNSTAIVHVTDITGKLVYTTEARLSNNATQVVIPSERISVKGMYMVEVITNGKTTAKKLSVF